MVPWGVLLLMLFGKAPLGEGTQTSASHVCFRASLVGSIMLPFSSSCAIDDGLLAVVTEGDEGALHKAMYLVHQNSGDYVALLFYASWCPFSKDCRSNFNILQQLFPRIRHFAFEGYAMRPSTLSRYGVHGFPTLFLLNSTLRIRYHGPRTIHLLSTFYGNVTGYIPTSVNPASWERSTQLESDWDSEVAEDLRNCPFSWASSPEKLLKQDTYLALATIFVIIRLLHTVWPKLVACCNSAWIGCPRDVSLLSLSQACLERGRQACAALNQVKNMREKARNTHARASRSLASVQ